MASKIAHGISLITNKSIVGIILTLVIICSTYFHDSNADISSFPLSLWSRLELDKNSIFWENALGLLGLFLTAILMYIILQYHFFLDVLVTDYAISILTLVFSIIYYYEINYDGRSVFCHCILYNYFTTLSCTYKCMALWNYHVYSLIYCISKKCYNINLI